MKKVLIVCLIWLFGGSASADACTLWAAAGDAVEGGGVMLVKNRDWAPDHQQELRLITPKQGLRYFGLFATGKESGLRAGINEKGLSVVSATAGSIPAVERRKMPRKMGVLREILRTCDTVDDALQRTDLFLGPQFIMMADRNKIAYIEIGPQGKHSIRSESKGALYHTNHYVEDSLLDENQKIGSSSSTRYQRISALLGGAKPFSVDDFISFSQDRVAGPDHSIWRTGAKQSSVRTLATWLVYSPFLGDTQIYVRLANPGQQEVVRTYTLTDIFTGSSQF